MNVIFKDPGDGLSMAPPTSPLITFQPGSRLAKFCRREKRFRVEVEREEKRLWVHCNNSGSLLGVLRPGAGVLISPARTKNRRLPYTLELVQGDDSWIGVNTLVPNRMLHMAWKAGIMPETLGYEEFKREAKVGRSRIDASLCGPKGRLWVEAKNVTLVEYEVAYFPDAVTTRGQKHLEELIALAQGGERAACFYLVQREDARCFAPADFIDPVFSDLFWKAVKAGVEVWPYQARVSLDGIGLGPRLKVLII